MVRFIAVTVLNLSDVVQGQFGYANLDKDGGLPAVAPPPCKSPSLNNRRDEHCAANGW
jgi:hypothetical protein